MVLASFKDISKFRDVTTSIISKTPGMRDGENEGFMPLMMGMASDDDEGGR